MRNKTSYPFRISVATLIATLFFFTLLTAKPNTFLTPSFGEIESADLWPVWPKRASTSTVFEPASLTSIGRDVIAWVDFAPLATNADFLAADVSFFSAETEGIQHPSLEDDPLYITVGGSRATYDDALTWAWLREESVVVGFTEEWFKNNANVKFPNENFSSDDTWLDFSNWKGFLNGKGSDLDFEFADSGHAPPQLFWETDPWFEAFLREQYNPSDTWEDKIIAFLPTNQGVLQCIEVKSGDVYPYKRLWLYMPSVASRQAVYHEAWKTIDIDHSRSRLTVLDGPVSVRDIEMTVGTEKQWRRIAIGSTGIGTDQDSKAPSYWNKLNSNYPTTIPFTQPVSTTGRNFGFYALDVTDPTNPLPLWSVSNTFFTRTTSGISKSLSVRKPAGLSDSDYEKIRFSVTKPVIGYTTTATPGNRNWHFLAVTIEKDSDQYRWYNINPSNGSVMGTGLFLNNDALPNTIDDTIFLTKESWENVYPTRILPAFPKGGTQPELTDVYVALSNGAIYKWNAKTNILTHIVTLYTGANWNSALHASYLTEFDIAYVDDHVYFSAVIPLDYNGASGHDTTGFFVIDLSALNGNTEALISPPGGDTGDTFSVVRAGRTGSTPAIGYVVQLQALGTGSPAPDFQYRLGSPVFVKNYVYVAQYLQEQERVKVGKEWITQDIDLTRLYRLPISLSALQTATGANDKLSSGNLNTVDENKNPINQFTDEASEGKMIFVDSEGNLIVINSEGDIVTSVDTGLGQASESGPSEEDPFTKMRVVYWKRR